MIVKLKGVIDEIGVGFIVLDVNGVGYHVMCSIRTIASLPSVGEFVVIYTEMLVSETSMRLVGFLSSSERNWFRFLDGVQGVGTKVALSILSTLSIDELGQAICLEDKDVIARAQGVGPKMAQRIVHELKHKSSELILESSTLQDSLMHMPCSADSVVSDAVSALVNLGYGQAQAVTVIAAAYSEAGDKADVAMLIRLGLKDLQQ